MHIVGYLLNLFARWSASRDKGFLSLVSPNPDARLLDMGCGEGEFTILVAKTIGTSHIYGADIWEAGLKKAESLGIKTIKTDLNNAVSIPSESFDVIISNQVIEHLNEPDRYVKEIHRILKPGGYCIISTENLASWDNIFSLFLGYTPFSMHFGKYKIGNPLSPHNYLEDERFPTHVRIFTYVGLLQYLPLLGLRVDAIDAAGHMISERWARLDKKHSRFITVRASKSTT